MLYVSAVILPRCFQSSGCFSYMWVLIGLFFLQIFSWVPAGATCQIPNRGLLPQSDCAPMVWSSHYPARCSNLVLLMHIGHSPINVCSMIFPHLWWFSSHVSSQFTTTWVSRQADVAEESAAETSAVPPAPPWHCPKPPLPLPPPPVAPRQRRPGRPWWPRGLPLRAAAAAPPAWTAPVPLAWRRRRRRRCPTWDIGRRGRINDETMKLGDSRG
jgi:hypothetical protein